jgi:hypothetical protein
MLGMKILNNLCFIMPSGMNNRSSGRGVRAKTKMTIGK